MKKAVSIFISCLAAGVLLRADQVEMQNGDRYFGKVLSLDTNTVVLQSDVLGTVRLPRGKIAGVAFGVNATTNATRFATMNPQRRAPTAAQTNGATDLSASLPQLGTNTDFIRQIQSQFLADAGPEANNKFNEMAAGLMSGKLTVNDIRAEAKTASAQLKELKRDLGDDTGALDGYLTILENFLHETTPTASSVTNKAGTTSIKQ